MGDSGTRIRRLLHITGAVQGVGFRPYVVRLARRLGLGGWVGNTGTGVCISVEGEAEAVESFLTRLPAEAPTGAHLAEVRVELAAPDFPSDFAIAASAPASAPLADAGGEPSALQPDAAVCADCLTEVQTPGNRRYRYAFTTCAACGPRYSLAEGLPFDRERTTMRDFPPCAACAAEYADPADRRFHAQTVCCPACGPSLSLRDASGELLAGGEAALGWALAELARGAIVAVKGVGGYHLMCRASDSAAVQRLRARKQRPDKPLAVLVADLATARALAQLGAADEALLQSAAAPIVLAAARPGAVAAEVAPGVGTLGILLAYTPLHVLLAQAGPLVATSGNLSDEPLCTEPDEARQRLAAIADFFLDHDRRIARPIDDSIVRVLGGRPVILRRARGYTPGSLPLPPCLRPDASQLPPDRAGQVVVLALGGQGKCALAVLAGMRVHLGEHLGSLDSALALAHFVRQQRELPAFLGLAGRSRIVACDAHPDQVAAALSDAQAPVPIPVLHHHAHALAALADTSAELPALAATWDGSGYGEDGTIWGGELLLLRTPTRIERLASLRPFPLPGGEAAVREPRRAALGLLYALRGEALWTAPPPALRALFSDTEWALWHRALPRRVNAPLCSSIGRLFDAVAALLGLRARATFEGQAAMELEAAAADSPADSAWPLRLRTETTPWLLDPQPLIAALLETPVPVALAARRFHLGLADSLAEAAQQSGLPRVLLTGGVFQNALLTQACIAALQRRGITALWHQQVPPNDGGIALGQALALAAARHADLLPKVKTCA